MVIVILHMIKVAVILHEKTVISQHLLELHTVDVVKAHKHHILWILSSPLHMKFSSQAVLDN